KTGHCRGTIGSNGRGGPVAGVTASLGAVPAYRTTTVRIENRSIIRSSIVSSALRSSTLTKWQAESGHRRYPRRVGLGSEGRNLGRQDIHGVVSMPAGCQQAVDDQPSRRGEGLAEDDP